MSIPKEKLIIQEIKDILKSDHTDRRKLWKIEDLVDSYVEGEEVKEEEG